MFFHGNHVLSRGKNPSHSFYMKILYQHVGFHVESTTVSQQNPFDTGHSWTDNFQYAVPCERHNYFYSGNLSYIHHTKI